MEPRTEITQRNADRREPGKTPPGCSGMRGVRWRSGGAVPPHPYPKIRARAVKTITRSDVPKRPGWFSMGGQATATLRLSDEKGPGKQNHRGELCARVKRRTQAPSGGSGVQGAAARAHGWRTGRKGAASEVHRGGQVPFLRGIVGGAKVVSKRPVCTWEARGGAPRLSSGRGRPPVASRTADSGRSVSDIFFRPPQTFKT